MTTAYSCGNCGAEIIPGQNECPQCGSEIVWQEATTLVRYAKGTARLRPRRGPGWQQLLLFGVIGIFILGGILMAGLWVAQQVRTSRPAQAVARPTSIPIAVQPTPQPESVLEPTPLPTATEIIAAEPTSTETPTLPAEPSEDDPAEAFEAAQRSYDLKDWQLAASQLRALREAHPDYQREQVEQMLFDALFNLAQMREAAGDMAAARSALDEAISLRPDNGELVSMQQRIVIYETGVAALGQNWEDAINALSALFELDPEFRDVPQRLFEAYVGYANSLHDEQPCAAVAQYQLALQIQRAPQTRARLEDARVRCGESAPTPEPDASPAPTLPALDTSPGRIAFTYFDGAKGQYNVRLWDAATQTMGAVAAEDALQPSLGSQGAMAARSTAEQTYGIAIYDQPGALPQRLTKEIADNRPRWSPDRQSILFDSDKRTGDSKKHLYVIDVNTRSVRHLGEGSSGNWSPNGSQIVFNGCDASGSECGLWTINAEGGRPRRLTSAANDSKASWSPDGKYIAFMSNSRTPTWDVFVAEADTGNVALFTTDAANDGLPVWSPDSKSIAFLSDRDGGWAAYRWSLDDLSVNWMFDVSQTLPDWQEASLDWRP
ncbi:MAG: PD40 domain-containing protein [Caldilineales bacterium]|nr:PD40 domain-containing protein [Caldilineales bacterium]